MNTSPTDKGPVRFVHDLKNDIYRAYRGDEIVPICRHCDNRTGCDFKRDDLKGCNSFSKITSGRITG